MSRAYQLASRGVVPTAATHPHTEYTGHTCLVIALCGVRVGQLEVAMMSLCCAVRYVLCLIFTENLRRTAAPLTVCVVCLCVCVFVAAVLPVFIYIDCAHYSLCRLLSLCLCLCLWTLLVKLFLHPLPLRAPRKPPLDLRCPVNLLRGRREKTGLCL